MILMIFSGVTIIQATTPKNSEERLHRFETRNSDERLHELADSLAVIIDLNTPGVAEGFTVYYQKGQYNQALDAYRDYVISKLRNPEQYNVPDMCVSSVNPNPEEASLDIKLHPAPPNPKRVESW
jgi:hypothetical protein